MCYFVMHSICDGTSDCEDGADEYDCERDVRKGCDEEKFFACDNGQCIDRLWKVI